MMTRQKAIDALISAGAQNDRQAWMRIYVENRISFAVAQSAWARGRRLTVNLIGERK